MHVCYSGSSVDGHGFYADCFSQISSVEQVLATIIRSVAFPALSEIARKGASMKAGSYRLHAVIAAVAYFWRLSDNVWTSASRKYCTTSVICRPDGCWRKSRDSIAGSAFADRGAMLLGSRRVNMTTIVAAIGIPFAVTAPSNGVSTISVFRAPCGESRFSYLSYSLVSAGLHGDTRCSTLKKKYCFYPLCLVGMAAGRFFVSFAAVVFEFGRHYHP